MNGEVLLLGFACFVMGVILIPVFMAFFPANSLLGMFTSLFLVIGGIYLLYRGVKE